MMNGDYQIPTSVRAVSRGDDGLLVVQNHGNFYDDLAGDDEFWRAFLAHVREGLRLIKRQTLPRKVYREYYEQGPYKCFLALTIDGTRRREREPCLVFCKLLKGAQQGDVFVEPRHFAGFLAQVVQAVG